jgi:hypothetical protein
MTRTEYGESLAIGDFSPRNNADGQARVPDPPGSTKGTSKLVIALSIFAALRILVFAVAFPLSNNVDERFHFMTIQMYAEGGSPGKELPRMDPAKARIFSLYWSPEYRHSPEELDRDGASRPLYGLPAQIRDSALAQGFYATQLKRWLLRPNFEAQSPPLYYVAAAAWYNLGAALGMRDWGLDYWPRFLNPIAYALLVWLSYRFVLRVYPERTFLLLAVPAIIAVFPQDVFFGMNRDVFSPPLAAAALLLMMQAVDSKPNRYGSLLLGSFLVGLAFLSSVSNCVLYGALAATLWVWVHRSTGTLDHKIWVVSASALAAGVLPSLWMLRNYLVMGDLTAGRAKAHDLGWTVKPLADMIHHPLFSFHGLRYFLLELTRSFWHGEYVWHGLPMRSAWADRFYILSSAIFVVLFALDFVARRRAISPLQRLAGFQAVFLVASSVLFLAVISLPFDFHDCAYPSRLYPYFVSGRIISGALLPFVLIYASGLELVTNRLRKWVPPVAVLACLMLFITVSEIRVRSVVFSSPYNFFALSRWQR